MLSPNEKNLYLSFIASAYAFIINSLDENADMSIRSVLSGRWKFVISASTALNLYGGYMNISVSRLIGCTTPFSSAAHSPSVFRTETYSTRFRRIRVRMETYAG